MSNTCEIWPLLVKWEVILEKRVLTYISEKVGHSDLNIGMYRSMGPRGAQNAQYIWNLAITGQMRGHFEKTRFDLYLGESRSQWPNLGYGSKSHLYVAYEP